MPRSDQLISFRCLDCRHTFDSEPKRYEDEPARAHPYRYFAVCPMCEEEVEQAAWQVGIMCANARATGPKTLEGKAKSSANLAGHPTPREAEITRFNALKHGAYSKSALYFPARPGQYPHCNTCDIDFDYCAKQTACLKRTELFMKHYLAFQEGNPELLKDIMATNQANLSALFEDMLLSILKEGVLMKSPAYGFDKEGGFHLAQYRDDSTGEKVQIFDAKSNPLLKPLMELLSKNNLSMADLNMTPKVQTDQGIELGKLNEDSTQESLSEFHQKKNQELEQLRQHIANSRERIKKDPVLVEHMQQDDEDV